MTFLRIVIPHRFLLELVFFRRAFARRQLAYIGAQIILATMAQCYRVHLAPNQVIQPGLLTLRPKNGVWVTLDARSRGR
jgi:hypothetical protein